MKRMHIMLKKSCPKRGYYYDKYGSWSQSLCDGESAMSSERRDVEALN